MAQGNVEIVRRMYEAFHGGDAERALAHFDDDVVIDASRNVDGDTGRGREELGTIIARWVGAFEGWNEEIEEMRDLGDHVCVVATQRGRGRSSGIETVLRYAVLFEIRDERITRVALYGDLAEALSAAGAEG